MHQIHKFFLCSGLALALTANSHLGATGTEPPGMILTWTGDPTTSIVIDWHRLAANSSLPAEIQFRPRGSETWASHAATRTPFPHSDRLIDRVEITGLDPDSEYEFRGSPGERTYWFRTMPTELDENAPLVYAAGGDVRHSKAQMDAMNTAVMQHDPAFIVWGGDLAYADGLPERVGRWYEFTESMVTTLVSSDGRVPPVVVGMGNHEIQGGYHNNRISSHADRLELAPYFYNLFAFPGDPGYGVLDFGDYLSIVMGDTDHSNPIIGTQTAWLSATLAARPHFPHLLPVYHVPAYPSNRSFTGTVSRRVRDHWVPLFEEHGIRLALEHHDHTYKRTVPIYQGQEDPLRGIHYIGDGSWGVGPRPVHSVEDTWYLEEAESVNHALIITMHPGHKVVDAIQPNGTLIDTVTVPARPIGPAMAVTQSGNLINVGDTHTMPASVGQSVSRAFEVTNIGVADLVLENTPDAVVFQESGTTSHNGFTITSNVPTGSTTLAPGASASFTLVFETAIEGNYTATIQIANNDPDKDPYTFTVLASTLTYTITYSGNNQTSGTAPAPQTKLNGVPVVLSANTGNLEKSGLFFAGWNTAADGSGTDYPVGTTYSDDADLTLYAKWADTLVLSAQGGAWDLGTTWVGGVQASPGFDYVVHSSHRVETPDGSGTQIFPGESLTLGNATTQGRLHLTRGSTVGPRTTQFKNLNILDGRISANNWATIHTVQTDSGNIPITRDLAIYAESGDGQQRPAGITIDASLTGTDVAIIAQAREDRPWNRIQLDRANPVSGTIRAALAVQLIINHTNALQHLTLSRPAGDTGVITFNQNSVLGGLAGSENVNLGGRVIFIGNNDADTTYSGEISNGSLTKVGEGTLTLSGTNSYTGPTLVNDGTLRIDGSLAAGTSVTVQDDAAIAGSGTIHGGLHLATGGIFIADGPPLAVNGAVSLAEQALLDASGIAPSGDEPIVLMTYGSLTGTFDSADIPLGWEIDYAFGGNAITLTPMFSGNSLLVYQGNGNTGGSAPTDPNSPYPTDSEVTVMAPGDLSKTGHTLSHWNTAADGSGISYNPDDSFTLTGHTTLFAQWVPETYTVTLDANGGSPPSPQTIQVTFGTAYGQLPTTELAGQQFIGWFTEPTGGSPVDAATLVSITSDHTLYARWNSPPVVDAGPDQVANPTGEPWTPAFLDLAAWYDSADTSTLTIVDGKVSAWNDKSDNGNHATQGTAANRPTVETENNIGGLNTVSFRISQQQSLAAPNHASLNLDGSGGLNLFSVMRYVGFESQSGSSLNSPMAKGQVTDASIGYGMRSAANSLRFKAGGVTSISGNVNDGTTLVFSGVRRDAENRGEIYTNGLFRNSRTDPAITSSDNTDPLRLGRDGSSSRHSNVDFGEILILGGSLTTVERQRIEGYLAHKWELAGELPADHPHKSAAPEVDFVIVQLSGSATDPDDDTLTYLWTVIEGPGPVAFADPADPQTAAILTTPGTYTLRLTASDGYASAYDEFVVTFGLPSPYEAWAAENNLTGDDADPTADPDGDGLSNLQEFAFGLDPTTSATGPLGFVPSGSVTNPGLPVIMEIDPVLGSGFHAVFGRRKDYLAAGLIYSVHFSADLAQWVIGDATPVVLTDGNDNHDIEAVAVPIPAFIPTDEGDVKPTFFRVGVSME